MQIHDLVYLTESVPATSIGLKQSYFKEWEHGSVYAKDLDPGLCDSGLCDCFFNGN